MKITRLGIVPPTREYDGTCGHCDCTFECTTVELTATHGGEYGPTARCPTCHYPTRVYPFKSKKVK